MQIILSPAKLMDFSANPTSVKVTKPLFPEKTKELVTVCRSLSETEIAESRKLIPKCTRGIRVFPSVRFQVHAAQPAASRIMALPIRAQRARLLTRGFRLCTATPQYYLRTVRYHPSA